LRIFWGASLAAELEYRINFITASLGSVLTLAGALFGLSLFYQHGYEMGGWSWPAALMVVGVYTLLDGFQAMLLAPNRVRITEYVREGTLDFVLLKPVDSQFWLSVRRISPWGLPNVVLGVVLLGYAGARHEPALGAEDYLAGLAPIGLGVVVLYSLGYMLSTLTVWFVKIENITYAMQALLEAGRYPIPAYPLPYRVFFTFILPVAFMTTVPAQSMIGTSSAWWLVGSMVLAVALLLISRAFWRFALRFYTSASS
jgi:ABC-2 type transport system permease protein